jgi:hypothetical protein
MRLHASYHSRGVSSDKAARTSASKQVLAGRQVQDKRRMGVAFASNQACIFASA